MKRLTLLLGCLCISAVAQQDGAKNPVLLDTTHPSVYLQYDHEAERKPEHPGEGKEGLWLSIHNNTRGAICIRTQSLYIGSKVAPLTLMSGKHVLGVRSGIEIAPLYDVEQDRETGFDRLPLTWHGDTSSVSWIPSGGSVLMSLPKADLNQGRRVTVPFSYEWETEGDGVGHEAYFYARQVQSQSGSAEITAGPPILQAAEQPKYPPIARAAHITGRVSVRVTVKDGLVVKTDVLSVNDGKAGQRFLETPTVENLKTWRFAADVTGEFPVTYSYSIAGSETDDPTNPTVEILPSLDVKITARPVKPTVNYGLQGHPSSETLSHEALHAQGSVNP
jgi:Gram-negative bacterial TonB protein C-terminal